jgi:ribosomal protein S17E
MRDNPFLTNFATKKICHQSKLLTHTTTTKILNKKDTHALVVRSGKFLRRLNRICGYTTEKTNQLTAIKMEAIDN